MSKLIIMPILLCVACGGAEFTSDPFTDGTSVAGSSGGELTAAGTGGTADGSGGLAGAAGHGGEALGGGAGSGGGSSSVAGNAGAPAGSGGVATGGSGGTQPSGVDCVGLIEWEPNQQLSVPVHQDESVTYEGSKWRYDGLADMWTFEANCQPSPNQQQGCPAYTYLGECR